MDDRRRRFEARALPHLDAAYNLARWLTRSSTEADDIVQDAMLRAFRAFDAFRGGDVKPWLLAIVRNCCLTTMKSRRTNLDVPLPETESGYDGAFTAKDADPETALAAADMARKLDRLIAELPPDYRDVLLLREMEDMSYRDIAAAIGVPIGTVMSRLARARVLLRDKWLQHAQGGSNVLP
jgi:RNA polymerase sigma-70 factor (ECF subfamily)